MKFFRRRKARPSFTSTKWFSARTVRQDTCLEILKRGTKHLTATFFEELNSRRLEYEKQLWKALIAQLTITGFLMLSLFHHDNISFSLFGLSASALSKAKEILLFCHALTIGFAVVLQQHVQKIEDFLVAFARHTVQSDDPDDEERKIFVFSFLSPVESFNLVFLPYRRNLHYNKVSNSLFWIFRASRAITFIGISVFTLTVPIAAAITSWLNPNFGLATYAIVLFWFIAGIFSVASGLLNVFPLPFVDYTYVQKLADLQKSDPARHRQVHQEIARTGKLPDI